MATALSIRFIQPFVSTHLIFTTGRIFSVGSDNPYNDRALVKHITVPYIHRPLAPGVAGTPGCAFGAYRRISQNIVASMRLPPGEELCLGLLFMRMQGYARPVCVCTACVAYPPA